MSYIASPLRIKLDWLHSLVQELEHQGVELPMGDYAEVYGIIEDVRDQQVEGVTVAVTTSDGADGATVVFVDTTFEPDASDGGPGLRVLLNDGEVYVGKPYEARPE